MEFVVVIVAVAATTVTGGVGVRIQYVLLCQTLPIFATDAPAYASVVYRRP
jgi:hypothetical protein